MPRLTNCDKLVSKHRAELVGALESIRLQLKPSYMWDLTSENCHQICSRLSKLNIDLFPSAGTLARTLVPISVIELHAHNNNKDKDNNHGTTDGITFFGSIPHIIANINSILVELDAFDSNRNESKNEVFHDSFFIDVSATLPVPCIMQHKEAVMGRKYILLHMRDYLTANMGSDCLNANDCLRTLSIDQDSAHFDLCFLTGVFLGYPVIYCNQTPDTGNCLSYQALSNYTVKRDHQVMYSFSVPQVFDSRFKPRVDRWFQTLCQRTNQPERLKLEQSVETHPLILT